MTTSPLTLTTADGTLERLLSARVFTFYEGPWVVDCEIDPSSLAVSGLPSGRVTLSVGGVKLTGTVDARSSGSFGPTARVRVVAGAGAWDQVVASQDFTNDGGVRTTDVYNATAALLGETVNDLAPAVLGLKFERSAGPARRVFKDAPWWVDTLGVTQVGAARAASIADESLVIHAWDATEQKVTFSCDTLVFPNTTLADARFNGATPTVYGVEQLFEPAGSMGWAWAEPTPCSPLIADLKAATLEWTRAEYLRDYRYRFVEVRPGGRFALQAVLPAAGLPDLLPITQWAGIPGFSTQPGNGQEVLVGFENADPGIPRIKAFSNDSAPTPVASTLDATASLKLGPSAQEVDIAGGNAALATGPFADALLAALKTFLAGLNSSTLAGQASGFLSALNNPLITPPTSTTKTKAT